MAFSSLLLCSILLSTCSGYNFRQDYVEADVTRALNHMKAQGFLPETADQDTIEKNRGTLKEESRWLDGLKSRKNDVQSHDQEKKSNHKNRTIEMIPQTLVDEVCSKMGSYLGNGDFNCSGDLFLMDFVDTNKTELAIFLVKLIDSMLVNEGAGLSTECVKSLVPLGSLYYLTTEQQFLGIYLTFYSQLMRTMLNAVIPVPEIYKATWAAHVLAGSFWWRPLGKFLDDLQPSFGITEDEWASKLTNNGLTNPVGYDGLDAIFPEWYPSVRKVLVRQVFHAQRILDTYKLIFTQGEQNCSGVGQIFVDRIKQLDTELNASLSAIMYGTDNLTDLLVYIFGDAPFVPTIVGLLQQSLQTYGADTLVKAATLFKPLKDLTDVDKVEEKAMEIFLESVSRSIRLWDTIGYIIHGLHLTAGSEVMNRHFYHTPTTDFNLVLIRLMQQLERFADTSLSKKMADIIMGLVELKRADFTLVNPVLWPAGSQLIDALAEQNNQTFDKDEALTLVEYIFAQIFLDKLDMVKQKATEATAIVHLPLQILGLFNLIKPENMNQVSALITMVALPMFRQPGSCDDVRVAPPMMARALRNFTANLENDVPEANLFSTAAVLVGKVWDVDDSVLMDLAKVTIPTVFEDLRTASVILDTFDSSQDTSTVVGSLIAPNLHRLLWTLRIHVHDE